jgi:hypothetical protein
MTQFTQTWSNSFVKDCTSAVTSSDATSANGTINMSKTDPSEHTGNFVTATYNVTLVTNNGVWQIDSWQQVS